MLGGAVVKEKKQQPSSPSAPSARSTAEPRADVSLTELRSGSAGRSVAVKPRRLAESLIIGSGLHLPEAFAVVVYVYNQLTSGVFPSISHRYTLSTISVYTRYSPHEKRCPLIRQLN
ncbi:hypothetical protein F2P81_008066 [Scophthalmus maximus]|uniref:Uncharacterized protein n=1 Tax=Scophthalmus maximus TaxID=52904 RepID=A0A6A4TA30_SCOMX|nr:hypothetical protein F2P81_008066 [Scophthalmus maximus]